MSSLPASVVVPARNAASWSGECPAPIGRRHLHQVVVVAGCSTKNTIKIARPFTARVLSEAAGGLPASRMPGARTAGSNVPARIDADVVLPRGSLQQLAGGCGSGRVVTLPLRAAAHRAGLSLLQTTLAGTRSTPGRAASTLRAGLHLASAAVTALVLAGPVLLSLSGPRHASARAAFLARSGAPADLPRPDPLPALPRPGAPCGSTSGAGVAAILVVAPAAAAARHYGLAGVFVLWSVARAAAAVLAGPRLLVLTR